jgi:16S rRNA (guanine966-N2)-methyltransferase
MSNQVRIIAGEWRSRQIVFEDAPGLRPTPSRVRETLFNWLQADILNSRCLDLYAGSGALGVEAASRGAKQVVQVEINPASCQKLRENVAKLAATQIKVVQQDVGQFLNGSAQPFDLVFLDPPFGLDLLGQACQLLDAKGWLADYAKIYLECERGLPLINLPTDWQVLKAKTAGEVSYMLLQKQSDTFATANGLK